MARASKSKQTTTTKTKKAKTKTTKTTKTSKPTPRSSKTAPKPSAKAGKLNKPTSSKTSNDSTPPKPSANAGRLHKPKPTKTPKNDSPGRPRKSTKASKSTATAATESSAGIPFPFIGAGDASYFEWADLHVRFTRPVKPAEKSKLVKTVPPPIGDVKWEGAQHLYLSSDQGVGRQIQAAYSKPAKQPTSLTTTSRFKMPDGPKLSRFNADTERWLLEAHDIVPIAAAYRRQDWEAGGTTLSPWHFASLAHAKAVLASLGKPADGSTADYMVRGIRNELDAANKKATA
ncbi:MAG: hypothetical protein H0V17_26660 [Deltaproteobacteria bacterium]|nr:hypothetical protein [Deltaproteobacteria bacterium]